MRTFVIPLSKEKFDSLTELQKKAYQMIAIYEGINKEDDFEMSVLELCDIISLGANEGFFPPSVAYDEMFEIVWNMIGEFTFVFNERKDVTHTLAMFAITNNLN